MDQTRYTLLGIFVSAVLAIMAGFVSSWYSAGARPTGNGAHPTQTVLAQTAVAVTETAVYLPTSSTTDSDLVATPIATESFYDTLLARGRSWPLIKYDSFDNNQTGWGVGKAANRASGLRDVADGAYVWDLVGLESLHWTNAPVGTPFDEFMVSVDVARDSAENGSIGLVFRLEDYENYFQYTLCEGSGNYAVWQKQASEWTNLTECREANAYIPDGPNTLTVVALRNSYFLYLNDTLIETFDNDAFVGGMTGVSIDLDADQTNRFIFDNFELRAALEQ